MAKITETFQLSDSLHPLMVNATLEVELENGCFSWDVLSINWVELQVAEKEGVDITKQIFSNPRAKALIESDVAGCEDQIMQAFQDQRERRKYA